MDSNFYLDQVLTNHFTKLMSLAFGYGFLEAKNFSGFSLVMSAAKYLVLHELGISRYNFHHTYIRTTTC